MTNNVKQEEALELWEAVFGKSTNASGNAEGYVTYQRFITLINQQVVKALEKLKGNGRMMSDVTYDFGTAMVVAEHEVVTVSDIDELIKEYKGDKG